MNRLPYLFNSSNILFNDVDTLFNALLPVVNSVKLNDYKTIPTDIIDKEDKFILNFDVGTSDKNNVSIKLDKGYLTVLVNNNSECVEDDSKYILKEISNVTKKRRVKLSNYMNFTQEPQASLNNGILKVIISKTEQVKTKQITIS